MEAQHPVIQLLCDLVALPSVNPERDASRTEVPFGEQRMVDYVERFFQQLGVRVERQAALPGRENVLAFVPGKDRSSPPILLEAHMDTVETADMPDPFRPKVEAGRVYGRGACDTKATLAAMMLALRQLVEQRAELPVGVCLAAVADEEFAMTGVKRLVDSRMAFRGAVVGEPTALKVVPAHNGQVYFRVIARGKMAHTSTPQFGVNAIYIMNEVISALRQGAASTYPFRRHPLVGTPQLTVSMIQGGRSEHVVPEQCEIRVDRRIIPGETWQAAMEEMQSWVRGRLNSETLERVEFEPPYHNASPVNTPTDHPLVKALLRAAEGALGSAQITGVPYNTDATRLAAAGTPCVVFGPGDIAQAHTSNEFVEIDQVVAAVEVFRRFLLESWA